VGYRVDIQALRGIAVLLVVLYHANILTLPGGYLGVDIFFVISGFLITTQITRQINNQTFSFREFYLRRAWRLIPAAYVVFAVCTIAAPWLLTSMELNDFKEQLIGAISFSANIVLWTQTGYFEDAAELKPLLHTWSLAIEEQYYLVMPALLYILAAKRWLFVITLLSLVSFALMSVFISTVPGAVFYLTPTRVWELGIGSALALLMIRGWQGTPTWLSYIACLVVLILPFKLLPAAEHVELNNLLVTLATALVIAGKLRLLNLSPPAKLLASVGTISYSLYLVHWPIFAFINSANLGQHYLSWEVRAAALIASFLLAYLLYLFVETRWRITEPQHQRTFWPLATVTAALIVGSIIIGNNNNVENLVDERRGNPGLSLDCSTNQALSIEQCRTSETPKTLVWGDSFAMHLLPGLKLFSQGGVQQAARSTCAPLLNTALYRPPNQNKAWSIECLTFNRSVMAHIENSATLELIVLSSPWNYLLQDLAYANFDRQGFKLAARTPQDIVTEIAMLVQTLKELGKKVVVVAPPPSSNFDIGKCHQRKNLRIISFGGTPDCNFSLTAFQKQHAKITLFVQSLKNANIPVYDFQDNLCDENSCSTILEGTVLYRDSGHLSIRGSEVYAKRFNLYQALLTLADQGVETN